MKLAAVGCRNQPTELIDMKQQGLSTA